MALTFGVVSNCHEPCRWLLNYSSVRNWHRPVTVHSTGTLKISRTVLLVRAASTAVAECSCTGMTLATGSPQLDNTISKPYCLFLN